MRPRGEIRAALSAAALTLCPVPEAMGTTDAEVGVTYLDLAATAKVGFEVARTTTKDMVKAGELVPVGFRQVSGIKRPLRTYVAAAGNTAANDAHPSGPVFGLWAGAN